MKIIFLSCFLLSFSLLSFGQTTIIKGKILSRENYFLVPYASINIINTKNSIDTDENGYFEITAKKEDSLLITCIGFEDLIVPVTYFRDSDTLFLKERFLKLDEVIIKDPVVHTFGIVNEKMGSSRTGGNRVGRSELTTLIEIPKTITSFRISKIFIKGKDFREENPIRLHIYTVNENGLPGEELLKKPIIITKKETDDKIITVDVKEQNIIIENASFFVGVQWITSTKVKLFTGPEIMQTYKIPNVLSYYREENSNFDWYVKYESALIIFVDGITPGVGIPPKKGNPLNMCASAEIEAF